MLVIVNLLLMIYFSKEELEYLINNNIMNGCMNKLAYYNLVQKCKKINDVNMKIKNK